MEADLRASTKVLVCSAMLISIFAVFIISWICSFNSFKSRDILELSHTPCKWFCILSHENLVSSYGTGVTKMVLNSAWQMSYSRVAIICSCRIDPINQLYPLKNSLSFQFFSSHSSWAYKAFVTLIAKLLTYAAVCILCTKDTESIPAIIMPYDPFRP